MKYIVTLKKTIEKVVVIEATTDEEADKMLFAGNYEYETERTVSPDVYNGFDYIDYKISNDVITSEKDLMRLLGSENIERDVYKYTQCGCCYRATKEYIAVNGYAEGSGDAECPEHILYFPFTLEDWETALTEADEEGVALWKECHTYDDDEGE